MTGYEYEKKCAEWLRVKGFTSVEVTPGSGDQGIDIIAKKNGIKYGIQCKYYEGNVGNKAVQEAFAGASFYDCDVAMVITNSSFTRAAEEMAAKLGVELWCDINAITFYESTKGVGENLSPEEKDEITQLEHKLQEKYQRMKERFPENAEKDAEITVYVEREKNRIDELMEERWAARYGKGGASLDSRSLLHERLLQKNDGTYMDGLYRMLESVDAEASNYVKSGISESSAKKLVSLIQLIYNKGQSDKWRSNHKKIVDAWTIFESQLPSSLKRRHQKEEAKETGYYRKIVSDVKIEIVKLRADIAQQEADIGGRDNRIAELLVSMNENEEDKARFQADHDRGKKELETAIEPIETELNNIITRLGGIQREVLRAEKDLSSLPVFAFKTKNEIKLRIENLGDEKSEIEARRVELSKQADEIKAKYCIIFADTQKSIDTSEENIRVLKREIEEIESSLTEVELKKNLLKQLTLILSLPVHEAKAMTSYKLFLKKLLGE